MMSNTYTPIVGGLEKSIEIFTKALRRKKHQVVVAAPEFRGMPAEEKDVLRLPAIQNFNHTDFSVNIPIPGLLNSMMDVFQPDIVHAHHPFLIGDMALRLAGQYSIPLVFTYHTMYEQYTHYLPIDNDAIKRFVLEISTGFANLADRVVAPSDSVRDFLLDHGVETPIQVIPTGIDIPKFTKGDKKYWRNRLNIPKDAFVIGHIGRLAPEKNLEFLARAVSLWMNHEKKTHFILAGDGTSTQTIKETFEQRGVSDRFHWTGILQSKKLIDAYHALDLFVFTSHSETQGMVVAEAMACGIPVIALDGPGVRDIVRDQENGRLIHEEDEDQFAQALEDYFLLSSEQQMRMRQQAWASAAQISTGQSAAKLLGVYKDVVKAKTKKADHEQSQWKTIMGRLKTEWELLHNLGHATKAAIGESLTA